jgi:hypothetical protein
MFAEARPIRKLIPSILYIYDEKDVIYPGNNSTGATLIEEFTIEHILPDALGRKNKRDLHE